MKKDTKYSTELRVIRYGTLIGRQPWAKRHKLANIDRGTKGSKGSMRYQVMLDQKAVRRWLDNNFPDDIWTVSSNRAERDLDGYELWATFHATLEDPPVAGNDPERRANRIP